MPKQLTMILPSAATLASLTLGVMAIMVLSEQKFVLACTFILLGCVLDVLDGQLAQRLEATSDIGKELDSLADLVTFGVAPTILLYNLMLLVGVAQPIAILTSMSFVLAGAFRLARFNTMPSDRSAYFKGMPIPMASAVLITGSFWQHWTINLWWIVVVVIVSYLMVSSFSYPKIKHLSRIPHMAWVAMAVMTLLCWLVAGWQAVPFGLFSLYTISGPILSTFFVTQRRRRARAKK